MGEKGREEEEKGGHTKHEEGEGHDNDDEVDDDQEDEEESLGVPAACDAIQMKGDHRGNLGRALGGRLVVEGDGEDGQHRIGDVEKAAEGEDEEILPTYIRSHIQS